MQTGHFRPWRYLTSPWLPLYVVLNLAAALRVLIFPSLLTYCYQIFHCSAFPTAGFHALLSTVISPDLSFSALFPFLIITDIFCISFWATRFPSSLLPILSFRPLPLVPHQFSPCYPVCMPLSHTALLPFCTVPHLHWSWAHPFTTQTYILLKHFKEPLMASLPQTPANSTPSPSPCWHHVLYSSPDLLTASLVSSRGFNFLLWVLFSHSLGSASLPKEKDSWEKTWYWNPYFTFYCITSLDHAIHWTLSCYPSLQLFPALAWISSKLLFIFTNLHNHLEFPASSWLCSRSWAASRPFCCSCMATYGSSLAAHDAVFHGVILSHSSPPSSHWL